MSTNINIKKKLAILDEGASVTTDATSIDFVGSGVNASTIDGDVTVTIPGGSGNTTYYLNQTVDQAPYKEFSSIVASAVEQVVPLTVLAGATSVIAEYQTPSGVPGTTQIPAGLWQLFLHFNAVAAGQNWIIRPTVYKRDLGGTETLIFTPDPEIVTAMSTTTTMYVCDGVFPATTILTTDRIVVKISMQNTTGVSQTVNFRTEGSQHYSVGLTTLNQVIPTGAVTSVTGTAPIVSSGGLTPAISIPQSSATVDGYLSSSNWSVFDAKQAALLGTGIVKSTAGTISYLTDNSTNWDTAYTNRITSLTTTGSGAATLISNVLNIPTPSSVNIYNSNGVLTSARTVDLNGYSINFASSIGTSTVNFAIDDGAGGYSYINLTLGGSTITSGSALSSKAFYVNNIGVGIYASSMTGPYYLPNSQPALNQIPYASSTSQLDFTSVKTINGNSILGSGDIVAGLSFFTEAQATTSPNNLVYANSLTAVATTTNADFVIQPKGTGAILCSIPNNTATVPNIGGNKRGQYAIDLQRFGTSNSPTEVASGNYSAIIGGSRNTASASQDTVLNGFRNTSSGGNATILNGQLNTASGLYSFIGVGQNNTASSTYSMVIGGYGNNSTGQYTISGGGSCTASGTRAVALGESNTASGGYSVALNSTNTASSDYSNARGLSANTGTTWGKWAIGGGGATLGSSQKGLLVQTTRTTGNTPTEIAFQGGGVDLRAQMTCSDNMGMRVKGSVIGKQSGSTNISAWDFDYVIVRGVGVGTTAIVGTPTISVVTNIPAWGNPTITADTGRGYASLKVIGAAATNIHWTATIESTEVIYA